MERTCVICGKEFEARTTAITCSLECRSKRGLWRNKRWASKHPISCQRCGKLRLNRGYKEIRPLCKQCYLSTVAVGELNHNWKGGRRSIGKDSYIEIYRPQHPKARRNYVLEHIIVWEEFHNQRLPDGWVIHHLNGIRYDNRPENLFALELKKHHSALVNQALQKRIRDLEGKGTGLHGIML